MLSSKHHLSSFNSTENSPCFLQCPTQLHQEIHPQQARTLCWLSFCIPDFKNKPQKKASFCLRVQSLRICFATVGEQLEHSPQAPPPSPLSFTPRHRTDAVMLQILLLGSSQPSASFCTSLKLMVFVCCCLKSYAHILCMHVPC